MIEQIKEWIDENCSITSRELVVYVREQYAIEVSLSTIDRAIHSCAKRELMNTRALN